MDEKGFIPASVVGGESIWISAENTAQGRTDITFDGYTPNGGYTLAYQFGAEAPFSVSAASNGAGTGWTLDVSGVQTLTFKPGAVTFAGVVTHTESGRVFVVDGGIISVTASPLRVSSWAAVVAAIDAAMLTVSTTPNSSITVDGMSVSYRGSSDLINLREWCYQKLREDSGKRIPRRILTRYI